MDDYELLHDIDIFKSANIDSLQSKRLRVGQTLADFTNVYNPHRTGNPSIFKEYYDDYKDYDFLNNFADIRKVRDQFTDGYVATFFNTRRTTFQFINYMYQTTYFNVLAKINRRLTTDFNVKPGEATISLKPLEFYEYIKMSFKGGTNMNVLFNKYLTMLHGRLATARPEEQARINASIAALSAENVTSKFAISDTDMSLDIHTVNIKRHKQIQYAASLCLLEAMTDIRTNLDLMWTNEWNNNVDLSHQPQYIHHSGIAAPVNFDALPNGIILFDDAGNPVLDAAGNRAESIDFDILLHEIAEAKEQFYNSGHSDPNIIITILNRYNNNVHNVNNLGSKNMIVCGLLIELLGYLEYYANQVPVLFVLPAGLNINTMRDRLFACARHKNHLLFEHIKGIYNHANKDRYAADILGKLQALQINHPNRRAEIRGVLTTNDILYELKQGSSTYCRVIEDPITAANITFEPCEDFILRMQDIPMSNYKLHETRNNPHYHYISYNTTILNKFDEYINDFVLFRIKLNGKVNGILQEVDSLNRNIANINDVAGSIINKNAPSEILDITISAHYDGQKLLKPEPFIILTLEGEPIYAYSTLSLVYDLGYILYRQIYYCPWVDGKYDKRVFRYIFLLIMHYDTIDKSNNNATLVTQIIKPLLDFITSINLTNPHHIQQSYNRLTILANQMLSHNTYNNPQLLINVIKSIQISSIFEYNAEYKHIKLIMDSLLIWMNLLYAGDIPDNERNNIVMFIYSKVKNIYRSNDILLYTKQQFESYISRLQLIVVQLRIIFGIP